MHIISDNVKLAKREDACSAGTGPEERYSSLSQPALKQVRCNLAPRLSVTGSAVTGPEQSCSFVLPEIFWSSRTVERKWILCLGLGVRLFEITSILDRMDPLRVSVKNMAMFVKTLSSVDNLDMRLHKGFWLGAGKACT
uniref:Uncharacterized protein n=1 Tax=Timema genevievae TaxID=629358 RepID=A0A7R9JSS8_TIMGE|nr:unnamed protein product [Timema genevievae]